MSPYGRSLLRSVPVAAAAVAVAVAALCGTAVAGAAPPSGPPAAASPVQQAEALAKPSVVFIRTNWQGWITSAQWQNVDLTPLLTDAIQVTTTCSGFIASPEGYIVTAAHCVDDESMSYGGRGLIVQAAAGYLAQKYNLDAAAYSDMVATGYAYWKVEGRDSGSPPERVVGVYPVGAASGISVTKPVQANVLDFQSFKKGDVALLKIESQTPLPALQVAPTAPAEGSEIVALGYPGSVSDTVDPSSAPSMKDGTISGAKTVDGVPFTEVSAATSSGMSGGPVIDLAGRVVGLVSWQPGQETQSFNFITATSSVHELLGRNDVDTTLSPTDQAYRDGLTAYFAGRYHDAAAKFEQVLGLEPDHAGAQEYHRLAVANYPYDKSAAGGGSHILLYALIGGGIVLVAAAVAAFLVLRKRRPQGGAAPAMPPYGYPLPGGVAPPPAPASASAPGQFGPPPATAPPATAPPTAAPVTAAPTGGLEPAAPAWTAAAPPEPSAGVGHYCSLCGEPHEPEARFCASCGFHFPLPQEHPSGAGTS